MKIRARMSDLTNDGFGWSENASFCREAVFEMSDTASDLAVSRRIMQELHVCGMKRDSWCSSDFGPWRSGCIGVYADIVE